MCSLSNMERNLEKLKTLTIRYFTVFRCVCFMNQICNILASKQQTANNRPGSQLQPKPVLIYSLAKSPPQCTAQSQKTSHQSETKVVLALWLSPVCTSLGCQVPANKQTAARTAKDRGSLTHKLWGDLLHCLQTVHDSLGF